MTEVMTYKELAERLDIKLASARRMVMRKRWPKVKGNDGETRVTVPLEVLDKRNDTHDVDHQVSHNDGHNAILELQMKVDHLQELLAVEKQRVSDAELDRDRWHAMAARPWWKKLVG